MANTLTFIARSGMKFKKTFKSVGSKARAKAGWLGAGGRMSLTGAQATKRLKGRKKRKTRRKAGVFGGGPPMRLFGRGF